MAETPKKRLSKKQAKAAAAEEQMAATKVQAIQRGHAARKAVNEQVAGALWKYRCLKCLGMGGAA